MKVKEESEKVGLKLNIQKTKIMASCLITSWEIDGRQWKQCQILILWSPKSLQMVIAAMKLRRLLLGRKVTTNLDSILKSRDITLSTKVCLVKAMVFPVVMYGCECWTVKKAESWRIDDFELWYWRRLLRIPWTARRSKQSILKDINPGCSLEGLMLKLKVQYFGHLMQRTYLLEKTLMLGGIGGRRRRGRQRMRRLDGITDLMGVSLSKLREWWWTGRPGVLLFMESQSRTQLSDWTEVNWRRQQALSTFSNRKQKKLDWWEVAWWWWFSH